MRGRVSVAAVGALLAVLLVPGVALASEQLWALLKGGGQVVLMRHASPRRAWVIRPGCGSTIAAPSAI